MAQDWWPEFRWFKTIQKDASVHCPWLHHAASLMSPQTSRVCFIASQSQRFPGLQLEWPNLGTLLDYNKWRRHGLQYSSLRQRKFHTTASLPSRTNIAYISHYLYIYLYDILSLCIFKQDIVSSLVPVHVCHIVVKRASLGRFSRLSRFSRFSLP